MNDFIANLQGHMTNLASNNAIPLFLELFCIIAGVFIAFYIHNHPPKLLLSKIGALKERIQGLLPSLMLFFSLFTARVLFLGLSHATAETLYLDTALSFSIIYAAHIFMKGSALASKQKYYILLLLMGIIVLFMTNNIQTAVDSLNNAKISLGRLQLTLWVAIKTIIVFSVIIWGSNTLSKKLHKYLGRHRKFSPSVREIIFKVTNITSVIVAILVALNMLGIDFTALTVFSGALGIGLGFGLKSVASNLLSGLILLMDKSIKPGDVISIDGQYGVITEMNARYCVLRTRNGAELLLPNEKLMSIDVINWSYSDKKIRQKLEIGVSYKSDLEQVQRFLLEAARAHKRVIRAPAPKAFIKDFGDNSVNFELRYWIKDPEEGLANLRSDLYMAIWKAFKKEGVEIPFPQMVLHREPQPEAEKNEAAQPQAPNVSK